MGAIIINHTEYGLIESNNLKRRLDRDGINTFEVTHESFPNFEYVKPDLTSPLDAKDTDKMTYTLPYEVLKLPRYDTGRRGDAPRNPSIPHPLLGTVVRPDVLADIGSRMTHNTDGFVQLISFNDNGIRGIMDVPIDGISSLMQSHTDSSFRMNDKARPYLQHILNQFGIQTGASNFVVVNIPDRHDNSKYKSTSEMDNRNAALAQLFFAQAIFDGTILSAYTVNSVSLGELLSSDSSGNVDVENFNLNVKKNIASSMGMRPGRRRSYPVHGEKGRASRGGNRDRKFSLPEGTSLETNPIFKKDGKRDIDTQAEGFHLPTYFRQTITPILKKLTHYDKDQMGGFIRNLHEVDERMMRKTSTKWDQIPGKEATRVYQYIKNMMEMDLNVEVPHHIARELTNISILSENINQAAVKFAQYEEVEATLETGRTAEEYIEFLVRSINRKYEDFLAVPDWQEEALGMRVPDINTMANRTMIEDAIEIHKEGRLWEPQYWDVDHWSSVNRVRLKKDPKDDSIGSALNNYHIDNMLGGTLDGVLQEGPGAMKTWTDKEKGKASKRFFDEPRPSLENPLDPKDGNRAIDINKEGFHLPTYLERVIPPMIEHYYNRDNLVTNLPAPIEDPTKRRGRTEWGPDYTKGTNYFDEGTDYEQSKLNWYQDPNSNTSKLKDMIRRYVNDVIISDLGVNSVNYNDLEAILDISIKTYEVNAIAEDIASDLRAFESPSQKQIDSWESPVSRYESKPANWFRDELEKISGYTDEELKSYIDVIVTRRVLRANTNKDEGDQALRGGTHEASRATRGLTIYKEDIEEAMKLHKKGRMYSAGMGLIVNGLYAFDLQRGIDGSSTLRLHNYEKNTGQGNYDEKGKANIPRRERDRLERDRLKAIEQLPPAERDRVRERDRIARANSEATIAKKKFNAAKRKSIDDERELLETDIKTTKSRGRDAIDTPIQIVTLKHIPTGVSIDIHEYAKVHDEFPVIVGLDVPARSEGLGIAGVLMEHARDIYPGIKTELYTGDASLYEDTRLASISDLSTDEIRKLIEVNEYTKERFPGSTRAGDYEKSDPLTTLLITNQKNTYRY